MVRILVIVTCGVALVVALMVAWRAPPREDPLGGISDAALRAEVAAVAKAAAQRAELPSPIEREPPPAITSVETRGAPPVTPVTPAPQAGATPSAHPLPVIDEARQRQQTRERAVDAAQQRPLPPIPERAPTEPWQPPPERIAPQPPEVVVPADNERDAAWRLHRSGGKSPHPTVATPAWRRP